MDVGEQGSQLSPRTVRPTAATVVLPAYGVRGAISAVVRDLAVAAYALGARGIKLDVLLLDDGVHQVEASEVAGTFGLPLRCFPGPPTGPAQAYLEGFRRVIGEGRSDLVITLDANGRHDPTQIPILVDHLLERRLDVVIGSRWAPGSGTPGLTLSRWILGKLANAVFRLVTSTRGIADATTSFKVAKTEAISDFRFDRVPVNTHSIHTAFVSTSIARGYRVGEAPIIYGPPVADGGGLQFRDVREFASHLLALRREVANLRRYLLSPAARQFRADYFAAEEDIECLAASKYFFEWVLDEFAPFLGDRILEVGAGTGTITRKLLERHPEASIVALEPADNMFSLLEPFTTLAPRVSARKQTLPEYLPEAAGSFDVVLYVNVLEHIENDGKEVRLAAEALRPGGALLVFGPALEGLYSQLDKKAGHYRRYSLEGMRRLAEDAGLRVVSLHYFDLLGVLPYYLAYTTLRRTTISSSTLWSYDRLIVPLSRSIQRILRHPPVGKNVILAAIKDQPSGSVGTRVEGI